MAKKKKKELQSETDRVLEVHTHISEVISLLNNTLATEMTKRFGQDGSLKFIASARILNHLYGSFYSMGIKFGNEQLAKAENENV